jgi:hypothetical protein
MSSPAASWTPCIRFGDVDASILLLKATTNNGVNELATAEVELRLDRDFPEPLELFSEVKVGAKNGGGRFEEVFTGTVLDVTPGDASVLIRLESATFMKERNPAPMWSRQVGAGELIYTLLRDSGHPEEKMDIGGLDTIADEPVLVVAPILGMELGEQVTIGQVAFIPDGGAVRLYADRRVRDYVYEPLVETSIHAVYSTSARLLRDAEVEGLHAIDVVLAYLQMQGRYGLLSRPNGEVRPFRRSDARRHARRGSVVAVEGLASQRCWVRTPGGRTPPLELILSAADAPVLAGRLTLPERQSLIAWQRAAAEEEPVAAAMAISDALEFYAAGVSAPDLFSTDELEMLVDALPALAPNKDKVVRQAVRNLNSTPLKGRVVEAASRDRAPLSTGELDFLWRKIRKPRNAAVHGKGGSPPSRQEIEQALSLVARLLIFRIDRKRVKS